jgi:hypothetical protein
MTDITNTAGEQTHVAAETEASREVTAQAAADNPNPTTDDGGQTTDTTSTDQSSVLGPPSSEAKPLERITGADRSRAEIAARFKEKRAAQGGQVEFHGDMRDPSQTYGPLGLAPERTTEDRGRKRHRNRRISNQQAKRRRRFGRHLRPLSSVLCRLRRGSAS